MEIFSKTNPILEKEGFDLSYGLNPDDLNTLKCFINDQWIYRLQIDNPETISFLNQNKLGIEDYHLFANKIRDKNIWRKASRILPPSFGKWFANTTFYKKLERDFNILKVSDEENFGWPNFYWRIVRPNERDDVGPLHRDAWFWELNSKYIEPKIPFRRLKVWIAIYTEPGLNGLLIEEYSHKRQDIKWKGELRDDIQKPVLLTQEKDLKPKLIIRSPGEAIVFHDKVLHGGAVNIGTKSRISLECTMFVKI